MTNKSNTIIDLIKILESPDIQRNLKILENFNKELAPVALELQKQAIPVLQTVHSALIVFAKKAAPYIEVIQLAQKAGVFDEIKRIHNGIIKQEINLNAYQNLSAEDVFLALKGQPEEHFEQILEEKFGTLSPATNTTLTSGLDLKSIELFFNIILLILGIYNQIQQANQSNLKPEEIAELAAKSAIETYRQIEQEQQQACIEPPRVQTTPKHENECSCTHHHATEVSPSQHGHEKRPIDNGKDQVTRKNREFLNDNQKTQNKEEWV